MATFLVLGAICWTTAQFSAFSIFRYDRGGPAVMAIGAVLFLNVGLGSLEPDAEPLPALPVLAIFSALAMLLLMRLQLTQQRRSGRAATSQTPARSAASSCAAACCSWRSRS